MHASCVVIGEAGVLIMGDSGAGKTSLALGLVAARNQGGHFAHLVSDDRTLLRACGGRLVARPHPLIAGQYELRGLGVLDAVHEPSAIVRLIVWCDTGDGARIPDQENTTWFFHDIVLPMVRAGRNHCREQLVLARLGALTTGRGAL